MEKITFRKPILGDADELFFVKAAAFRDEFELFNYTAHDDYKNVLESCDITSPEIEKSFFSHDWHNSFCNGGPKDWATVILCNDKIVGSIVVLPAKYCGETFDDIDLIDGMNCVVSMYILPEYKNRGIGEMSIKYAEKSHPASKWILSTPADVSPKNVHFYKKCGFVQYKNPNIFIKGF